LAALSTTVGAMGSVADYVNAADGVQTRVRLVAAMVAEKLKEVRGRLLSTSTDARAVVLSPDELAVYQSIVGTTYEMLPAIVSGVEAMLAAPAPPVDSTLDDVIDPNVYSDLGEAIFTAILSAWIDLYYNAIRTVVVVVVAEVVGAALEEIPYVGWFLGPATACAIKASYGVSCDL
jgi:hypothetical protein